MNTPEGNVKRALDNFFSGIGALAVKPVLTGFGTRTVDYCPVIWEGLCWMVEVKRPGFRKSDVTTAQITFLTRATTAGAWSFVVDSDEMLKILILERARKERLPLRMFSRIEAWAPVIPALERSLGVYRALGL